MINSLLDVHTHTLASGHAYSTMSEMIAAAQQKGLKILGITEHGTSIPGTCGWLYFKNYWVVPRQYGDLKLMLGAELNILNWRGDVDMEVKHYKYMDLRIAGIHSVCWEGGTPMQNTDGIVTAMHNPWVQMISHPCDGTVDLVLEPIVLAAKETGTILELNNNSLRPGRGKVKALENNREMLKLCMKHDVPVIIGSDAHITFDVANHSMAKDMIAELNFPEELVFNDKPELFLSSLKKAE